MAEGNDRDEQDQDRRERDSPVPRDTFSSRLRELRNHPEGIERNGRVELYDFYGNLETWHIKTISHDGQATVFLERGTSSGGERWMLPPEVIARIYGHRDGISDARVSRGAKRAAVTRQLAGVKPFAKKAVGQ